MRPAPSTTEAAVSSHDDSMARINGRSTPPSEMPSTPLQLVSNPSERPFKGRSAAITFASSPSE